MLVVTDADRPVAWTYNDLAPWNYVELPKALGCSDWYTARVTTLGELDEAMKTARVTKMGAYIEIIGGKMVDSASAIAISSQAAWSEPARYSPTGSAC